MSKRKRKSSKKKNATKEKKKSAIKFKPKSNIPKKVLVRAHKRRTRSGRLTDVKAHVRQLSPGEQYRADVKKKWRSYAKSKAYLEQKRKFDKEQERFVPTMFDVPKYGKYADIVSFEDVKHAGISSVELSKEYLDAKTNIKQLRICKVAQLARNRAYESAKRKNLSTRKKKELIAIGDVYGNLSRQLWGFYKKKQKRHPYHLSLR